ncbi:chemoreceptor glutamine deamidase CheD [Methylomagnum ishizawai]|uniref:chemoreceptor glutamine deamidase CheD n=1 Tax=Methylomagnum ishizawai TaxID=1760988 RepID=UPI001C322EF2|nr:chemoreceptor glutamine deamidase CheD [Methylomagnum ishizawai]BBL76546.1 putative chemoreceptor glutamine deamidase CheD 1 [Methylomagnum ishizawai]
MKHGDPRLAACLPGFEEVRRYWDEGEGMAIAKILPGEYYVTAQDEQIVTVLGSCVAACIRDRVLGIGGMNHFMLPSITGERLRDERSEIIGSATRYGNYAMEHLINTILGRGGQRKNLEVKVFGGGKLMPALSDVGERNIRFVTDYLAIERMPVLASDLGDIYPRKVVFYPASGRVRVKKLKDVPATTVLGRELRYRDAIKDVEVRGEVDLF